MSINTVNEIETRLDSFDPRQRTEALHLLMEKVRQGQITFPPPTDHINMHCHTFFSDNCYGYSPTKFAWLAKKAALALAGIVDFDVLTGMDEFLTAAQILGLKASAGIETRVFLPEFADKVMTSPGEPGITYHMGVGFPGTPLPRDQQPFLTNLYEIAQRRNRDLTHRVNNHLQPAQLDYEKDVMPLTPAGNPTERHICLAYAKKARKIFPDDNQLAGFWSEKLGVNTESLSLPDGRELLNTIRAKTMKRGGVGYVQPDVGAFPKMKETNDFFLAAGAIPTLTWLDGTSNGEKEIEELLAVAMQKGVAAINIIPDRNYTAGLKDEKSANLQCVVQLAEQLDLPIVVGTEMNSPGQKFVDDFSSTELAPLLPIFLKGAHIVYAHSVLQRQCALGYTSRWAADNFATTAAKNDFYQNIGKLLKPAKETKLSDLSENSTPREIIDLVESL